MSSPISNLPKEMLGEIFGYVNKYELMAAASVSKDFHEAANINELWKRHGDVPFAQRAGGGAEFISRKQPLEAVQERVSEFLKTTEGHPYECSLVFGRYTFNSIRVDDTNGPGEPLKATYITFCEVESDITMVIDPGKVVDPIRIDAVAERFAT